MVKFIPDIISSNFWLRDFKEPVFVLPPSDPETMKKGIVAVISTINPQRVQNGLDFRIDVCLMERGMHREHL